eukprot:g12633.t1
MAGGSHDIKLFVGLDFGTAYSGYATAHAGDLGNVEAYYNWTDSEVSYCKTLTALYYEEREDGYLATAWGHTARKRALNQRARKNRGGMYVSKFKLLLDHQGVAKKGAEADEICLLPPGVTVVQAVADYLRFMYDSVIAGITKQYDGFVTPEHIQWCLTVPAMWTDRAKAQMREAAHMA